MNSIAALLSPHSPFVSVSQSAISETREGNPIRPVETATPGNASHNGPRHSRQAVGDKVEISQEARKLARNSLSAQGDDLNIREQAQIRKLQATDTRVRAHELAHLAAAGGIARGGASFQYQRGPDGQLYAVGGEVSIDASPVPGDPDATLRKSEQIQRAALAPANPSQQDRAVAAKAAAMANEARAEKLREKEDADSRELAPRTGIEGNDPEASAPGDILDLLA